MYSDLFKDIIKRDSAESLLKYVSGKDCTVMLMNVCFERPIAIIRSEKSSSTPFSTTGSSQLAVYGINQWNSPSAQRKLEMARLDIEMKKKQVEAKAVEESKAQKFSQLKTKEAKHDATSVTAQEEKASAKQLYQAARKAVENAKREVEMARQAYSREIQQAHYQATAEVPGTSRPMTTSALELQHQGFKLVQIFVSLNPNYLVENTKVVQAMRWLWRSRGRHYRLLYEEEIHPRYHHESLMLAKFLVSYSEANPDDLDVLFDLIRIFLKPASTDFSFIKQFLLKKVSSDLSPEQKKQVLQKFLTMLHNKEGSEETKILGATMLVTPLLKQTFYEDKAANIVSDSMVEQLMSFVLHGPSITSKLTCELLQIVTILLENTWEAMIEWRKELIKYLWNILKDDDTSAKNYAYLAVSRFFEVFETPPKIILQVYRSLLRAHNTSEKGMINASLDILVATLPTRLGKNELDAALQHTVQLLCEEGNSIPQLALLFEVITRHPTVYAQNKRVLMPHMLLALSSLGLVHNAPTENKELSLTVARLIIEWSKKSHVSEEQISVVSEVVALEDSSPIYGFEQSMVDTLANFFVRLALMNAEAKHDKDNHKIRIESKTLLKDVLSSGHKCTIHTIHFEEVFALSNCEGIAASIDASKKPTSNDHSSRALHPSSSKDESDGNKSILLLTSLEILQIIQSNDPGNEFLTNNAWKIIEPCFVHYSKEHDSQFKQPLHDTVVSFAIGGYASSEAMSDMIAFLDNEISLQSETVIRDGNEKEDAQCGANLTIAILEDVHTTNLDFVDLFISSLLAFAKARTKEHVHELIGKKSSSSMMAAPGNGNQLSATPTLGIYEQACGLGLKASVGGKDIVPSSQSTRDQTVSEVEPLSSSLTALIICIRLLSSSSILSDFSNARRYFMEMLAVILDSSISLPLLMTVVAVVGKWIMTNRRLCPLTVSEVEEFLWRIALLDFDKYPEVSSSALRDMICCIALSAYGYDPTVIQMHPFGDRDPACDIVKPKTQELKEDVLKKLFSLCLLSANVHIRTTAIGIYAMQMDDCVLVHQELSEVAIVTGSRGGDRIDVVGTPSGKGSYEIMQQLLALDFDSLGKRLWTVVFVDVLLACSNHGGGVILASQDVSIERQGGEDFLRLKVGQTNGKEYVVDLGSSDFDAYSVFREAILSEKNSDTCGRGRCIAAVRNIVHGDVMTCQSILESCFQAAWQHLDNDARLSLVQPIQMLLAGSNHSQFLNTSQCDQMNAIQSMVRLLVKLRPIPVIDEFLISSLAPIFNVHHEVLTYLETLYVALKRDGFDVDSPPHDLLRAIQHGFKTLEERDVDMAISSSLSRIPGTKLALSLDMYGFVTESNDAYLSLMDRTEGGQANVFPFEYDFELWEGRWVEAQKDLNQWRLVDEIATSAEDHYLMMESCRKTEKWDKVKSLYKTPSIIASLDKGDPECKITEIYLAIQEGHVSDVDNLHAQSAQMCLYNWQLLPTIGQGSHAHKPLFERFQRLGELRESGQIILETSSHAARRTIPDLKTLLSSWRHRIPNSFEPVSVWEDLFSWRFHVFDAITSKFDWAEASSLATLHDRPFAAISLGRSARKQGLQEVSTELLSHLTDGAMDVGDAFLKLREQIVAYQNGSDDFLKGGLNLVNSTNLSFFDARQKAELFRLKGYFLRSLNDEPKAHQAYCHAVQISPTYARGKSMY